MAAHIRNNQNIPGIKLQNIEFKLSQFADDTTYFLRHTQSLDPLLEFMDTFSQWSGLRINRSKSSILPPGDFPKLGSKFREIPVVSEAKILGIWFLREDTLQNRYLWNFKPKLQKIRSVCASWMLCDISLKGKVTVVNSLLISTLQFPSSVTYTPPQVFDEYRRLITEFVWSGKKPKVSYNSLVLPVSQGGLGLADYPARVEASLVQWIKRILQDRVPNVAASLSFLVGCRDLKAYFAHKPGVPPVGINHNPFYQNLFKTWDVLHGFSPEGEDLIRRELLWNNKFITAGTTTPLRGRWEAKGIHTIHDICHPSEARLLSHQELSTKYDVPCSFLDMLSLRLSVPLDWRGSISANWVPTPDPTNRSGVLISLPGEQPMDVLNVSPKQLYQATIGKRSHTSTAFERWHNHPNPDLQIANADEWHDLSANIYKATREKKLQAFHFKIINRIIPC